MKFTIYSYIGNEKRDYIAPFDMSKGHEPTYILNLLNSAAIKMASPFRYEVEYDENIQ